jgi:hypothetical protein
VTQLKTFAAVFVVCLGVSANVFAAPPLNRPSPPPCCADGQCLANPLTSGYYPTRWRRWPLEYAEPVPVPTGAAAPLPEQIKREAPPFERPRAEQEDEKAPEPSVPRTEQESTGARPYGRPFGPGGGGGAPTTTPPPASSGFPTRTGPSYPGPGTGTSPMGPLGPPSGPMSPPTVPLVPGGTPTPPGTTPPQNPLFRPNPLLNRTGPTGDSDPPPSLPLGPQPIEPSAPAGQGNRALAQPSGQLPSEDAQVSPNDPPPAPPNSLLSAAQ